MIGPIINAVSNIAIKQAPKIGSLAIKHGPKLASAASRSLPKIGVTLVASQAPKIISKVVNNPWGLKPSQWNARILVMIIAGVAKTSATEMMQAALLLKEWLDQGKVSVKAVQAIIRTIMSCTHNLSGYALTIFEQILAMKP